ncbi:MAG: GAF domain-containing protein [Chloroflexi bacterium]|nr:GAF domain-containing protein [Chloroflexota bacterium]
MKRTAPYASPKASRYRKQELIGGNQEINGILQALSAGECCRFIGARYHHKSRIMRAACARAHALEEYVGLYVSLGEVRVTSSEAFYRAIHAVISRQALRYCGRRLAPTPVRSSADLAFFLGRLPLELRANTVLFVDDLELAPAIYIGEVLNALRAAYESTSSSLQFLAVVCASNSLANTALGPTSPFENISRLIAVQDLTQAETDDLVRQMLKGQSLNPTTAALALIYEETSGDRYLVQEICRECCKLVKPRDAGAIGPKIMQQAIRNWMAARGQHAMAEGLQHIESDPELLAALLDLLRVKSIAASRLPFDATQFPDPLTPSGLVAFEGGRYRIKSRLHRVLLKEHFSSEHVGRNFLAAGDWQRAIKSLGSNIREGTSAEREPLMFAVLNAMYTMPSKQDAFQYFQNGLTIAYPHRRFKFYDFDPERQALAALPHLTRSRPISLKATHRPEVRALLNLHDYWLEPVRHHQFSLMVPLRLNVEQPLGVVVVENLVTQRNFRQRQEDIQEFVGYVRHAARALKNRGDYEQLFRQVEQRAADLRHLLTLTRQLMSAEGSFQEILDQALRSAVEALGRHAQMGSIYLFERETGLLKMRADTGYPESVRARAQFCPGEGLAGHVYQTGRPYRARDTRSDAHYKALDGITPPVLSSLGVPLIGARGSLGMLCLDNRERTNAFDDEDEHLLNLFAGQVALWLENVRLLEIQKNSREAAFLASRLLHQMTSAVALVPELVDEVSHAVEDDETIQAPARELNAIAQTVEHIGSWLGKYVRVGDIMLEPVDVPALLQEVIDRVDNQRPANVTIKPTEFQPPLPSVYADRMLIGVLFENLLQNSYDALRESVSAGQVCFQVWKEQALCMIRISDNGPGIGADNRAKIWDPGWTTKGGEQSNYGRGLGLPLCRQIVAAHEGTLTLDDTPEGTSFTIRLPINGPQMPE